MQFRFLCNSTSHGNDSSDFRAPHRFIVAIVIAVGILYNISHVLFTSRSVDALLLSGLVVWEGGASTGAVCLASQCRPSQAALQHAVEELQRGAQRPGQSVETAEIKVIPPPEQVL